MKGKDQSYSHIKLAALNLWCQIQKKWLHAKMQHFNRTFNSDHTIIKILALFTLDISVYHEWSNHKWSVHTWYEHASQMCDDYKCHDYIWGNTYYRGKMWY